MRIGTPSAKPSSKASKVRSVRGESTRMWNCTKRSTIKKPDTSQKVKALPSMRDAQTDGEAHSDRSRERQSPQCDSAVGDSHEKPNKRVGRSFKTIGRRNRRAPSSTAGSSEAGVFFPFFLFVVFFCGSLELRMLRFNVSQCAVSLAASRLLPLRTDCNTNGRHVQVSQVIRASWNTCPSL